MKNQKVFGYFLFFILLGSANGFSKNTQRYSDQSHGFLHFLYSSSMGSVMRSCITGPWFSKAAGWYADSRLSKIHIKSFIKKHAIPMHESIRSNPSDYRTFNDFFTRTLKPEARPIGHDPASTVSPADGTLFAFEHIGPQTTVFAKNKLFDISTFLKDADLAKRFYDGTMLIIYLAPWNYHRFHMPLDGIPSAIKPISGRYESVNPLVYMAGKQPLQENERKLICIETSNHTTLALVCVGALCVGRITHTYAPGTLYKKGEELGYFSLGGSTIVMLFEKNAITLDTHILEHKKTGVQIQMGQKIGISC